MDTKRLNPPSRGVAGQRRSNEEPVLAGHAFATHRCAGVSAEVSQAPGVER